MENLSEAFSKYLRQFSEFWGGLSLVKKSTMIAAVVLTLFGLGFVVYSGNSESHEYLFKDLSQDDVAKISQNLRASGFEDFIVDSKGIKVKSADTVRLRIQLAEAGLPNHGVIGWEKFDEESFTRTEFEQNIQRLRAIQGELQRTIMGIEGVKSARVHIVMPKQSLFIRDEKKPTASIYVKTAPGVVLNQKQITGIQHLVSFAVEGLEKNGVTIIDQEGNTLTEEEPNSFASKLTKELLTYKNEVEDKLERNIKSIVGKVVGHDRVEAQVDADVDFTQETQTISNVDPDDAGILAKSTTGQKGSGSGLNPTGIPGSKSNVPGEQEEISVSGPTMQNERESETINYELSKVVSEKTLPVGNIKRLTVSVLVDGKQAYLSPRDVPEFIPRTEEEMKQITQLIKNAVGFKDGRDSITVQNMMFQLDPLQKMEFEVTQQQNTEDWKNILWAISAALGVALFFFGLVRPYLRWLTYDPEKKQGQKLVEEFNADLELGQTQNIQVQEDVPFEKLSPEEQVFFLAKNEPKRTTEAIRIMLNPHQNQGV